MTIRIYKQPLNNLSKVEFQIRGLIDILSIKKQNEQAVIYYSIDSESTAWTGVRITGQVTGMPFNPGKGFYQETLMFNDDSFVVHFYVEILQSL